MVFTFSRKCFIIGFYLKKRERMKDLSFSEALEYMKAGHKVSNEGYFYPIMLKDRSFYLVDKTNTDEGNQFSSFSVESILRNDWYVVEGKESE